MQLNRPKYRYRAQLVKVVDGDTVDLKVDLGFYMSGSLRFRVLGVDTPELRGGTDQTKILARRARDFVVKELICAREILIRTEKADSFGRWLAEVQYQDSTSLEWRDLAEQLISNGLGKLVKR